MPKPGFKPTMRLESTDLGPLIIFFEKRGQNRNLAGIYVGMKSIRKTNELGKAR
jgi:hypothetical protein